MNLITELMGLTGEQRACIRLPGYRALLLATARGDPLVVSSQPVVSIHPVVYGGRQLPSRSREKQHIVDSGIGTAGASFAAELRDASGAVERSVAVSLA